MKLLTRSDNRTYLALLLLILLALALRVYRLDGQSLWSDEGLSLYRSRLTLAQNLTNIIVVPPGVATQDTNPPLYFVALSAMRALLGESEYALRFLSVIAGMLLVSLLYVTGKRLFSTQVAMLAAALGALSPFLVWYSQEARMYTPVAALTLASVYLLLRAIDFAPNSQRPQPARKPRQWLLWIAWGTITLAALATHFIAFSVLPFEGMVLLVALGRTRRREALIAALLVAVLAIPLIAYGLTRAQHILDPVFRFRPLDSIAQETWSSFLVGSTKDIFQPWWAVAPGLSILIVAVIGGLISRTRRISILFTTLYLGVPLLAFYAVTFIMPLYVGPRHIIFTLPPIYLLLAYGLATTWQHWRIVGGVAVAAVFGLMVWWLDVQFTDPAYLKDDIRSAACTIAAQARPDDVVIMSDAIGSFMFDYYYTRCGGVAPWKIVPTYPTVKFEPALRQFQVAAQAANRVWFLVEPNRGNGFDSRTLDEWARGHLLRLGHQRFPSMWLGASFQLYTAHFPIFDAVPSSAVPTNLSWPMDDLQLLGVEWSIERASAALTVRLDWRLDSPGQRNLATVARVIDSAGAEVASIGGVMFDNWSVRDWPVGKIVQQTIEIELPADLPPGPYRLHLTVSERKSNEPIAMQDGSFDVEVAKMVINR